MVLMNEHPENLVFRVPEHHEGSVSIERAEEIAEAEAAGIPIEVTPEERAELNEAKEMLRESIEGFNKAFTGNLTRSFKSMYDRLSSISPDANHASFKERVDAHRQDLVRQVSTPPFDPEPYTVPQDTWNEIAEIKQQERDREERNSVNIQATADVMKDMLAEMGAQAEEAAARDLQARKSASRNLLVAIGSLFFAVLAVIAPFVIEAIKGWK